MLNAIQAALQNSVVVFADNQEINLYLDRMNAHAFAASNNLEIDLYNETAVADTNRVLGEREIKIAEYNGVGAALVGTYLSLGKLISGDNTPQPTATTTDEVYHGGRTVTTRTGVTNGNPTWTISGYDTDPEIALLLAYAPGKKAVPSGKEGRPLAFLSYNLDRSFYGGKLTVLSAYARSTDSSAYIISVVFEDSTLYPSSQNPAAGGSNVPQASQLSPDSGPVGSTVTVRGLSLDTVESVRFGPDSVAALTDQTPTEFKFVIPAGAAVGNKLVVMVYDTDEEAVAGIFEVTNS